MDTLTPKEGGTLDVGYVNSKPIYPSLCADLVVMVAGRKDAFICNKSPSTANPWMSSSLSTLGPRTLRQLCMPGSHNSGMSRIRNGTFWGTAGRCQNHTHPVLVQLIYGVRHLDIRPVIFSEDGQPSNNVYYAGHYDQNRQQGACGQDIDSVIDDINSFISSSPELVIVRLSVDLNTDTWRFFDQDEWHMLFARMQRLRNFYIVPDYRRKTDLTKLRLDQFIGNRKGAVVVVFDPRATDLGIDLGPFTGKGFYYSDQFPMNGSYANSNDNGDIIRDQLAKLSRYRTKPDDEVFSLEWYATQSKADAVSSAMDTLRDVQSLARYLNPWLLRFGLNISTPTVSPNIISTDNVVDTMPLVVATAINAFVNV